MQLGGMGTAIDSGHTRRTTDDIVAYYGGQKHFATSQSALVDLSIRLHTAAGGHNSHLLETGDSLGGFIIYDGV